jgi:hypothetical protein
VWITWVWERTWSHNFCIYLDYPVQPYPRDQDREIVELFLDGGQRTRALKILNRCRLVHKAIYLSCILKAEGNHIDPRYLQPPTGEDRLPFFKFSQEQPTREDWILWEQFWRSYCGNGLRLPCPLGDWKEVGHKIWQLLYDTKHDKVYKQTYDKMYVYDLWVKSCTRAGSMYSLLGEVNVMPVNVTPITIRKILPGIIAMQGAGPKQSTPL